MDPLSLTPGNQLRKGTIRERLAEWGERQRIFQKIHWLAWVCLVGFIVYLAYKTRNEEWSKPEILMGWVAVGVAINALIVTETTLIVENRRFNNTLNRLEKDIIDLEDATRRNLDGFHRIFERSLWLLKNAEREIIYANFVLGFGYAHAQNPKIRDAYMELQKERKKKQTLDDAVNEFWTAFRDKAGSGTINKIKIVSLKEDIVNSNFLDLLSKRDGYDYLETEDVWTVEKVENEKKVKETRRMKFKEYLCFEEARIRRLIASALNACERPVEEWRVGPHLPVQILIAGLPPRPGNPQETRSGCIVFLLGTESIAGVKKTGDEKGFYTELQHIIDMYRDFVDNTVETFE